MPMIVTIDLFDLIGLGIAILLLVAATVYSVAMYYIKNVLR